MWNADVHVVSKFLLLLELPFTTLRKITVPIPCEGYYVRALIALAMAVSPLWIAYYLWHEHEYSIGLVLCCSLLKNFPERPELTAREIIET